MRPNNGAINEILEIVEPRVTDSMNDSLLRPFLADEVIQSLNQMHPYKSPDPDGMSPVFYQYYWHIVGKDVLACVLDILNNASISPQLNLTNIVLIPKIPNPDELTHFRPISLCNMV
ncbi:UNVERIFIED_CONTAM: hypothetical protein Slati_1159800 [Sesamum latifolium]|uniref:Reverse transcriptase n=1 Tax=Sesamum latifolium TaxID=2727402 RepID=A0AAW2XG16_9LAMI